MKILPPFFDAFHHELRLADRVDVAGDQARLSRCAHLCAHRVTLRPMVGGIRLSKMQHYVENREDFRRGKSNGFNGPI
jgi:hypothetical protein